MPWPTQAGFGGAAHGGHIKPLPPAPALPAAPPVPAAPSRDGPVPPEPFDPVSFVEASTEVADPAFPPCAPVPAAPPALPSFPEPNSVPPQPMEQVIAKSTNEREPIKKVEVSMLHASVPGTKAASNQARARCRMNREHEGLLGPEDPPPFRVVTGEPDSPFLLTCDHGGRVLPRALGTLGLSGHDLERHIAWDIGAAQLAEHLARALGSFLIVQTYSRLVIDCNRPLHAKSSIAEISEATVVPGNQGVSATEAERRAAAIFRPYHARIDDELERRRKASLPTTYIAVHSFTPRFLETDRKVEVGVLYGRDPRFAHRVLERLRRASRWVVGDNEPYAVSELSDYGVIQHAERRSLPYVELEIRQDLIAEEGGQVEWAGILAAILRDAVEKG
jgi:predicted N-formylglutamate amidohydrolase